MNQIWLIPVDESDVALKPIDWLITNRNFWREMPKIHLLNVQASLPRDIGRFINADTIREFHQETAMAELAPARAKLAAAEISAEVHILVGEAASSIAEFAETKGCSQILLGTRGHSGLAGSLLGSVATKLTQLSKIPLLLVR
jgi:nucleotide-binding universal stress UspA family protein